MGLAVLTLFLESVKSVDGVRFDGGRLCESGHSMKFSFILPYKLYISYLMVILIPIESAKDSRFMRNTILAIFTGLMVVSAALPSFADSEKTRFIAVQGKGTVTAVPDIASINTSVSTRADTAREALMANNRAMSALFQQFFKAGIDENAAPKPAHLTNIQEIRRKYPQLVSGRFFCEEAN